MGRPREHDDDTRLALLDEAARIIDTEGIAGVTARRLAAANNVSTRAIYSLFGGMDGVLTELFRLGATEMVDRHFAVPTCEDAATEILPLALAYRAGARARPEVYSLIYERCAPNFRAPEELVALLWRCNDRIGDAVTRALAQREITDRDPAQVTRQLWATVHGHAALELRGFLGPPAVAEQVWRATITSLVADTFATTHPVAASAPAAMGGMPSTRRP
ncbi:MAG TPA: TetR/AcrR family transcriptional regulator [Microlunatus sp.]|nr:TetR/AcrR family transcriptional regulator [Microlunatus sp.]